MNTILTDLAEITTASESETFLAVQQRSDALAANLASDPLRYRVLTGDRPTGPLHLGHLLGSLNNRVRLQRMGVPVTVLIADYQVITDRDEIGPVKQRVLDLVADYLAVGLDPDQTVIFPHSAVPALNQLLVPFLSLVTDAELRRNPTVKAELELSGRALSGLLLTYPVHQAADILAMRGTVVPVGRDQLPHLELTRQVARRFNARYGHVFAEPEALLSPVPSLLGTDGNKMSKSRGNTIAIGATEDETAAALKAARTDSQRAITFDPAGRPEVSSLLTLGAQLSGYGEVELARQIGEGAGALKSRITELVNEHLRPIRARRRELAADRGYLSGVLLHGIASANDTATGVLRQIRTAMGTEYLVA